MNPQTLNRGPRSGFTLVEVLVALVVAGLFLAALGRAMSGAWSASRAAMDVVSGVILARDAALGAPAETFRRARERGYRIVRENAPVTIIEGPSGLAPAPAKGASKQPESRPQSTPAAMRLGAPKGISPPPDPALTSSLTHVAVTVATPAGRAIGFDTIRLDNRAP